jgi:GH35 family endo-1,4-beta-xylanase
MKTKTLLTVILLSIILVSCAPASISTPTETPVPTATITLTPIPPTPTATTEPMFTIGDEQIPVRLIDSAIPPFINAMKAVEINLSVEQIKTGLVVQKLVDYQGNPFRVVVTSNTGDSLADGIPLLQAEQKEGTWQWESLGLNALGEKIGMPIGITLWYKDNKGNVITDNNNEYDRIVRDNFSLATLDSGIAWKWAEQTPGGQIDKWSLGDMKGQLEQAQSFDNITNLRLHTVLWAQHYPDWLSGLSADESNSAMIRRIEYLANKYKGIIQEVVVVNEPYYSGSFFVGNGSFTRPDTLYDKFGQNYLVTAFTKARELFGADVKLIYNDTANHSLKYDWNGGYTKVTQKNTALLAEQGLIDYVGMQTHLDAKYPPSADDIIQTIQAYKVPVVITELDVRLDSLAANVSESDRLKIQAQIYTTVIEAAIKSGNVKEISFGQVGDKYSWFVEWMGSPNADGMLFDNEYNPKLSYYAVLKEFLHQVEQVQPK